MLLWPQRLHIGVGQFPADLKFYWLHFEVTAENDASITEPLLAIPQHTRVGEPQYIISLFRQFLREQENIHRSMALELILLLILQQISAAASEHLAESPGNALARKRSKSFTPGSTCRLVLQLWRKSCIAMRTIWGAFSVGLSG